MSTIDVAEKLDRLGPRERSMVEGIIDHLISWGTPQRPTNRVTPSIDHDERDELESHPAFASLLRSM